MCRVHIAHWFRVFSHGHMIGHFPATGTGTGTRNSSFASPFCSSSVPLSKHELWAKAGFQPRQGLLDLVLEPSLRLPSKDPRNGRHTVRRTRNETLDPKNA